MSKLLTVQLKEKYEESVKNECIYSFLIEIYPRNLEFDVLDLLKDMVEKPPKCVNEIINIVHNTNCIFKEHVKKGNPIRIANNIFMNIIAFLGSYGINWKNYTLQLRNLEYVIRTFNCYGINLSNVELIDMDFSGGHFLGANFNNANLSNSNLRGATFRGGNLQYINFSNAILSGADLRGTDLRYANLTKANLRGADLRGADLRNAKMDNDTNLHGISINHKVHGVYRQVTREVYNQIKKFGNDIDNDVKIIEN